jgi:uncharacterized membrane protein YuzA (DUF378 family)
MVGFFTSSVVGILCHTQNSALTRAFYMK